MSCLKTQSQTTALLSVMLLSVAGALAQTPPCNTGLQPPAGVCTNPDDPAALLNSPKTGLNSAGGSTLDPNWQIAVPYPSAPSNRPHSRPVTDPCSLKKFEPAWVDLPDAAWLVNDAVSDWITPQIESSLGGYYIYRTSFNPGSNVYMDYLGQETSDNETESIYLDVPVNPVIPSGCFLLQGPPVNCPGCFNSWTPITVTNQPVAPGLKNYLYFVVRNRGVHGVDQSPTDTGLRVEFSSVIFHN